MVGLCIAFLPENFLKIAMPGTINMAGIRKDTQLHLQGMERDSRPSWSFVSASAVV